MSKRHRPVVQVIKRESATSGLNEAPKVYRDQNHSSHILSLMKRDTTYCDVTIEAQDKQFRVHKNLFGTYSTFFDKEFADDKICKVELDGIKADIAEALVNFFYTGNITINFCNVFGYLMAADYLMIKQVKEHATKFLLDFINEDNCLDIWHNGKKFDIVKLKTKSATFVGTNLKAVVEKDAFALLGVKDFEEIMKIGKEHRTTEEENYLVVVSWIKRDLQSRRALFNGFFQNLNHSLLSKDFLKDVALNEDLVRCSADLVSIILDELVSRLDKLTEETTAALNRPFKEKCLLFVIGDNRLYKFDANTTTCSPLPVLDSTTRNTYGGHSVVIGEHGFRLNSYTGAVERCTVQQGRGMNQWSVFIEPQNRNVSRSYGTNTPIYFSQIFAFNDKLYLVEQQSKKLQVYDVVTNGWTKVDLPHIDQIANICSV